MYILFFYADINIIYLIAKHIGYIVNTHKYYIFKLMINMLMNHLKPKG